MCHRYSLRTSRRHPASSTSSSPSSSLDRAVTQKQTHHPCQKYEGKMHVHDTLAPYSTDWFYLWEAEAVSWTAGCLCMTGSWLNLKTSPTTWWRTDMLPNPEAKSSGSRCCLSSTDREPCLKNTSHWKLPLYNQRPTYNLCITLSHWFLPLFLFFLSVIGPHKTYTPAAIAAAIPPMTPQFFIILFLERQHYV